jgi:hypothetical protein
MERIESTKYAVFNYGHVVEDGGLVISDTDWATQAPIVSPVFKTRDEACEWLNSQEEDDKEK